MEALDIDDGIETSKRSPVKSSARAESRLHAPVSAFCVTVYNEKCAAVEATLRSIVVAVNYGYRRDSNLSGTSVICLIADGRTAMDPDLPIWLRKMGLLSANPMRLFDTELHFQVHGTGSALLQGLPEAAATTSPSHALRTMVCIKSSNRGKLHSHALFFDTLCQHLRPRFCFQVDAGTTLTPEVVLRLTRRLRDSPDVAAVAPRVMPVPPEPDAGFLTLWQYADFAGRNGVLWPFELATGHLSVIPGQTCVFRWRALRGMRPEGAAAEMVDPLSAYLGGADHRDCLARIMYLAEDRVIGNQVVLAAGRQWKLDYAPEAIAETDSCTGPAELLRQRRRWNNSEMANRWWLLRQLSGTLRRTDRTAAQNHRFTLAVCSQMLLAVREFLLPAQLVAILAILFRCILSPSGRIAAVLTVGWLLTAGTWALLEWVAATAAPPKRGGAVGRVCRSLRWGSTALFLATAFVAVPLPCTLVLLAPALYLPSIGLVLPRAGLLPAIQARIFYLPHLVAATALSCYSFWNLHDVSWGTKGLCTAADTRECRRRLRHWRNVILYLWLATNGVAAAAALSLNGWLSTRSNPIAEIFALLDAMLATISWLYLTVRLTPGASAPRSLSPCAPK
jgi:chitin synthase